MKRLYLCLLLVTQAAVAEEIVLDKQSPPAAKNTSDKPPKVETDLIDGLILNRAMTRFGHRFYREFVAAYRDIGGVVEHSGLTIVEQATARSGSKISILHNRKPIYITVVSPASRNIDDQALVAASRVNQKLRQNQRQASWSQFLDPDLAPDEF
ncbi:curli production assembly/transport protein CsgE [uncultured Shewanella sp.]|uniref:curli production assembly/transport protein CsgE n=1 Tax=uncultured Shewanella sp. TaxID=173975 RepID=UPI0026282BE4|nr:curli production assembly/transport protein CsgE [uncultured Shewanella sp.]